MTEHVQVLSPQPVDQATDQAVDAEGWMQGCLLPMRARVKSVWADGWAEVELAGGQSIRCEWLLSPLTIGRAIGPGDAVLVMADSLTKTGIIAGRVGRRAEPGDALLDIQAPEGARLACGEASIELRADGRVLIKGEDVTVHAKGTQRIRAGTVAIN